MSKKFKTIIGLEIHIQLDTASKMFCSCDNNAQGKKPNENVCPICLGMPGVLPVANKQAIKWTIKTGLALGCEISKLSKFDRKHYFYPDLPKGFQISQYNQPFCKGGSLTLSGKKIRLNRIHLEEDAGKLVHRGGASYVDLNRAGTPLMEVVTEPDITSPEEAKIFPKELQLIVRTLGVSEASMEKGHLRCDANINVMDEKGRSSEIVELKNLNSFRFIEKALKIEEKRLRDSWADWPSQRTKVTRGFDSKRNITYEQRRKEESADYRYFSEPDVPPLDSSEDKIDKNKIKKSISLLPSEKADRLKNLGLPREEAKIIIKNKKFNDLINNILPKDKEHVVRIAKLLINEKLASKLSPEQLVNLSKLIEKHDLTSNIVREIIVAVSAGKGSPTDIYSKEFSSADIGISKIVREVLAKNKDVVKKYRQGKKQVIGFLIGEVMKEVGGRVNPNEVREELLKKLQNYE